MESRMKNPALTIPGAMDALQALGKAVEKGGVARATLELVNLRASQINGCAVCLDIHSRALKKLFEEIGAVLRGRTPTAADVARLPYTEMIVREAIRLFPPAPFFARQPTEDVTVGEWDIPKGSLIVVSTYALHRDPRFFPEPEHFNPDRFAPGWEERISRFAYLPFGGGPRVCIGNGFAMMEARLVLATVAQRCKLLLESNTEIAPKQLVTLRPSHAVRMRVEKRADV